MMRRISFFLTGATLYSPVPVFAEAITPKADICSAPGLQANKDGSCGPSSGNGFEALLGTAVNLLIFVAAAIAVIIIIIGGINYVTSTGDAARVKRAKDTILYAVIGLVVAILAYAIVNFIIGAIK